jgi:hypothetical protein
MALLKARLLCCRSWGTFVALLLCKLATSPAPPVTQKLVPTRASGTPRQYSEAPSWGSYANGQPSPSSLSSLRTQNSGTPRTPGCGTHRGWSASFWNKGVYNTPDISCRQHGFEWCSICTVGRQELQPLKSVSWSPKLAIVGAWRCSSVGSHHSARPRFLRLTSISPHCSVVVF